MERYGDLAGAQIGTEVAADLADGVDDVFAQLLRDCLKLLVGETVEVLRFVDLLKLGWHQ
jgi:hypothetical protein